MPTPPPTAPRYYAASAAAASAARHAARAARPRGLRAIWQAVFKFQIAQAVLGERAVERMLTEQGIEVVAQGLLNSSAFTTSLERFEAMLDQAVTDWQFDRLMESLVQDAGRSAQSVAIAARPTVAHVRHLNLPSCSRCAVLAGRVYRFSEGFERHPGCDCVMIPVTVASPDLTYDVEALARSGQIAGLSKADLRAIADGADTNQVVNVRLRRAGLVESGRVLRRRGRLTPEGIYQLAGDDQDEVIRLLKENGYLR